METNRISSLESHGKALEKECCLPGVFCDSGDTPANILCKLNGHLMPCASCFYGKWVEDCVCWPIWSTCLSCSALSSATVTSQAIGFHLARGRRVVPSGRLLSSRIKLIGSFTAGIWARLIALHRMSFIIKTAHRSMDFFNSWATVSISNKQYATPAM